MKSHALRGWVECSDGRLYHPVIAELAMDAWETKRDKSRKGKAGAAKRWNPGSPQASLLDSSGIAREEKGKEGKRMEEEFDSNRVPEWIDPKVWHDFVEFRKEIKHPLTPRSIKIIWEDLLEWKGEGHDPNLCLRQSMKNSWRGVFRVKGDQSRGGAPGGRSSVVDRFVEKGTTH